MRWGKGVAGGRPDAGEQRGGAMAAAWKFTGDHRSRVFERLESKGDHLENEELIKNSPKHSVRLEREQ